MTHTDLIARLRAFAAGCRGSMWQSRDETIRLCDAAANALTAAQEREQVMEAALTAAVEDLDAWVSHGDDLRSSGYDVDYTAAVARRARAALDAGQLCNSTVEMAECAAFSAGYEAGERDGRARPMCDAPKDGTPVLVKIKDDLSPWGVNQSSFSNSHMFCGLYAVMRNYGDIQDWGFAAPVGRGGFPDEWLDGWWPLPGLDRAALAKGGA